MGNAGGQPAHAGVFGGPEQLLLDLLLLRDVLKDQYVPLLGAREPAHVPLQDDMGLEVPAAGDLSFVDNGGEQTRLKAREQSTRILAEGIGLLGAGDHLHGGVPVGHAVGLIERGHAKG
ncbi:MAG: hypothetical protein H6Q96_1270, partial [Nitrospirae bacterium]|nr:hypothetical protein [Nitrospirota bacterium]